MKEQYLSFYIALLAWISVFITGASVALGNSSTGLFFWFFWIFSLLTALLSSVAYWESSGGKKK